MSTPTGRREALEVLTRRGLSRRKACCYPGLSRRVAKLAKLPPGSKAPDPEKNGIIPGGGVLYRHGRPKHPRGAWKGGAAHGVQMVFDQGGYVHQESYNHPWTRWALLYSIVQIAQNAPEPQC